MTGATDSWALNLGLATIWPRAFVAQDLGAVARLMWPVVPEIPQASLDFGREQRRDSKSSYWFSSVGTG